MKPTSLLGVVSLSALGVHGWGASGHQAVGYVAMHFLTPKALSFVQSSLGSTYHNSLGPAATWPDEIRHTSGWGWSAPLHFVDAKDVPPSSCSVQEIRDCGTGKCILTAIANYTTRVVDKSLSKTERTNALKFLDHFIGDIGQPLHVESSKLGGNQIAVTCSGSKTNLHHIWDSNMIDQLLRHEYSSSVTAWADALATRIKSGSYQSEAPSWISCSSTTSSAHKGGVADDIRGFLKRRAITPLRCPLTWAQDSNAIDCSYVFNYETGVDLCTSDYYTNAVPIIETQIAKSGYRLAAWLNVLFDGSTGLPGH